MSEPGCDRDGRSPEPMERGGIPSLIELNRALAFGTPLDEALDLVTGVAHRLLGASTTALVLERGSHGLELVSWQGIDPERLPVNAVDLARRLIGGRGEPLASSGRSEATHLDLGFALAMGALIVADPRRVGLLIALRQRDQGAFEQDQVALLSSLAHTATTAIRNAALLNAERRKTTETKALSRIARVMAGTLDLDQLLQVIGDQAMALLPVERCLVLLLDETGERVTVTRAGGQAPQLSSSEGAMPGHLPHTVLDELGLTRGHTIAADGVYPGDVIGSIGRPNGTVKSAMVAPLVAADGTFGAIYVDCLRDYHHWTRNERQLLEAVAEEAAVAIQATQLYSMRREETEISNALLQVSTALGRYHTLDDVMRTVVEITPRLTNSDQCSAWLWDPEHEVFSLLKTWGLTERTAQPLVFSPEQGLHAREMLQTRAPVIVEDVPASGMIPQFVIESISMKSLLTVPILSKGEVVGAMHVIHTRSAHHFRSHEITLSQGIANLAGLAIDNARLSEQTVKMEALRRLDQLKTELLANVSHELRTPLTAIKGLTGTLLQDDLQWDQELQRDFLQTIADQTEKLERIVGELLDMSRIEAGTFRVHTEPCDIAKVIARVSALMQADMKDRPITVRTSPGPLLAYADERRVDQVLSNLLHNAHKHTPPNMPVAVSGSSTGEWVTVQVRDHGPGIAEQHIEHIFERFYQVPSDGSSNNGTGLGLAICRGIVEAHGGKIWAESRPGEGATFIFTLPVVGSTRRAK